MGVQNVEGRQTKCGATPVLYTYPAWTFGGKRSTNDATPGPGPGTVMPSTFSTVGPAFGRSPHNRGPAQHGPAANSGTAHIKPGFLSAEKKGPAWSFGNRLPPNPDGTPGPQDYNTFSAMPQTMMQHPAPSWGPPSRQRAFSAPRARPIEERPPPKPKGPSMKGPWKPLKQDPTPGPNAYQPLCNGCCKACDGNKGPSFGLRPPMFYGKVTTTTPGPAGYHTECSTIGAATQNCASGSSTFRRNPRA